MAIVPVGVAEAVTRYTSNPGTISDIIEYARQARSVWEFGQRVRAEFGTLGDSVSAAVEMAMEEADATWQRTVGAFNEMRAADARRMAENAERASRVNNERRNRAVANGWNQPLASSTEVEVDQHGEIVESNNGGRNPINSGGTPVGDIGRGGRPRGGLRGTNDFAMEGASEEPVGEAAAARSGGGGGPGGSVSKETPISNYPSLSYGLQETHTTILPWTGWCSAAIATFSDLNPVFLKLRMNTPYDMFVTSLNTNPAINATPTTNGLYAVPLDHEGARPDNQYALFPETMTTSTNASERPAWRDYWAALYSYYTVLGCEYKITMINPSTQRGQNWIVASEFDSYSDTATSTGNVMPSTYLSDAMAFKGLQWQIIETNSPEYAKNVGVVSGKYRPGQVKRNIVNDGDVKTWTPTTATPPNLKEDLVIAMWRAPLSYHDGGSSATTMTKPWALNIQVELKYIVQFKDLKQQARYPNRVDTAQDIAITLNEDPTVPGTAHQKWTT